MPLYEYLCEGCQHQFEVMQGVHDRPKKKCPTCGKQKLRRLLGVPALKFVGNGWTPKHYGETTQGG